MDTEIQIFKALSDETRLRTMLLLTQGELCVCDLENILQTTQSKISRHLSYLKNSGLVQDRRSAVWVYYSLVTPDTDFIHAIFQCLKNNFTDDTVIADDRERLQKWLKEKQDKC
jgi:ArsR family transcriptional regulator